MNEKIINERWDELRKELKSFQKSYLKTNKLTQDKIQEIVKSYNITKDNLNKRILNNDKQRLLRKIKEWKNKGLVKGYFEYQINDIFKKPITYNKLIEILLYGAFIEEQESVSTKIDTIFELVTSYCYSQGLKDLRRRHRRRRPRLFEELIQLLIIDGVLWKDYFDALILTNAQDIHKKYINEINRNKEINIYDHSFQRLFEKLRNRLISTSNDKYSGGLDKYATALGNMAYIEASGTDNQKVKFISDMCDNVTEMCSYMNGMIFNTRERNKFKRPYGDTQKDLLIQNMDVMGLVLGINQPPIINHFHWCHSTLTYLIEDYEGKTYKNITNKWFKQKRASIHYNVEKLRTSFEYKGKKYVIDNHNVKYEYKNNEKDFAEWLSKHTDKQITMLPKINNPEGIKTPDFIIDGEYFDYKNTTGSSNQLIYHNLYGKEEQAKNFIIEINNDKLDMAELYEQVDYTYRRLDWVEKIGIKANDNFVMFERK